MPQTRKVKPRRVAQLQRKYLRQEGATPQEIRRYQPVLTAQIGAESNFTQGVGSPAGARDIAQFMPGTAPGYGVKLGDNRIKDDIRGQVRYMLPLLRKYGVEGALRGYNAGPGAIEASKGYSETNNYVKRVRSTAAQYGGLGGAGGSGSPQYETVPGVDRSADRQALLQQYVLQDRGKPNALLELQTGLENSQDVPETRRKIRGPKQPKGNVDTSDIVELFWNGPDAVNIDNGQRVKKGYVSGHTDHAHAWFKNKKLARRAAQLAVDMGLHVGEYSPMDKVDPVHTKGSGHYRKGGKVAMDVSGNRMGEWANRVARGDF